MMHCWDLDEEHGRLRGQRKKWAAPVTDERSGNHRRVCTGTEEIWPPAAGCGRPPRACHVRGKSTTKGRKNARGNLNRRLWCLTSGQRV